MLLAIVLLCLIQYSYCLVLLGSQYSNAILSKKLREAAIVSTERVTITNKTIVQLLDHFDKNEKRTWKMRYFERLDYFLPGRPVYVFIGGEGKPGTWGLNEGLMHDLAKETHGALFKSEHRYYGESIPLPYEDRRNLKYLSSRQALADLAALVKMLKSQPEYLSSKVVVVGGSYPGNLAVWFRLLYPTLVDAAVASSAPVLAKVDFYEYLETVGDDYQKYGIPGCYEAITKMFANYVESFKTAEGREHLRQKFNICEDSDLTKPENKQQFFMNMMNPFETNSQFQGHAAIKTHCEEIMQSQIVNEKYSQIIPDSNDCNNCTFPPTFELRYFMFLYQKCTEFGKFVTTSSRKQPFPDTLALKYYYEMCSVVYNVNASDIKAGVKRTNEMYGGLRPNVTQVVFTNGDADPYHRMGILKDLNEEAPARVIPNATHCQDLLANRQDDSEELLETRMFVKNTIKKWIGLTY